MRLAESYLNLYLIRHGESVEQTGIERGTDSPLSALGWKQAELAGRRLGKIDFDRVEVSPLRRTRETLAALSLPVTGPVAVNDALIENNDDLATVLPRVEAVGKQVRQYAADGLQNVLLVSHCMFLSDLMIHLMNGGLEARTNIYIRLSNARLGLVRIPREPGFAAVLSGWNIDAATAVEYEKVLYP